MRHSLLFPLVFLFGLLLGSCKKDVDAVVPEALFGKDWYNTRQQPDAAGFFTYKVQGTYAPQGGWGVDGFRLEASGTFVLHTQGPVDELLDIMGTWQAEGTETLRVQLSNGQPAYLLAIKLLDDTTLRAKQSQ